MLDTYVKHGYHCEHVKCNEGITMIDAWFYDDYYCYDVKLNGFKYPQWRAMILNGQDDGFGNYHIIPYDPDDNALCFINENIH